MRILSIQSSVVFGHVGNSVAAFALQRLGHEVWPLPTALLAHHTGYGSRRGRLTDPALIHEIVDGLDDLGVLGTLDAVLVGYLGAVEPVEVVEDAIRRVRRANPSAVICVDPVLGDTGRGFFVPAAVAGAVRARLIPAAGVVTPNLFELAVLTGHDPAELVETADVVAAAHELRAGGPDVVLVTSVPTGDDIGLLAVTPDGRFAVRTPRLDRGFDGAGDLTAALFLGHLSTGPSAALARTAAAVHAVLTATLESGDRELSIVRAQDWLLNPPVELEVTRLG